MGACDRLNVGNWDRRIVLFEIRFRYHVELLLIEDRHEKMMPMPGRKVHAKEPFIGLYGTLQC